MAIQQINIGTAANDGTGDPLRTAWDKANQNFDELDTRVSEAQSGADASIKEVNGYGPDSDGSVTLEGADIAGAVLSVNDVEPGTDGDVELTPADIGAASTGALAAHVTDTDNPHSVTKSQVGLSAVTNDAQVKIASNLSDLADTKAAAWRMQPIGVPIPVMDNLTGANAPPTDQEYRYIVLTSGLTGAGQYNEGVLTNESVSGSAPLVLATADIDDAGSPMNGQTVRLINTERRFLRPGSAGTIQEFSVEQHAHGTSAEKRLVDSSQFTSSGFNQPVVDTTGQRHPYTEMDFYGASETKPRNLGVTYYMRIR